MSKGIKTFWKNMPEAPSVANKNQILKNACYINFKLESANYASGGNFWQRTFGGTDDIALTTSLTYKNGEEKIEAITVLNRKQVKVKQSSNLATNRIIGEKIPAIADSMTMEFKMTAIQNDKLQQKFDMLNKPEYQAALQLAPKAVGQVLTITSLVKNLLSDTDPQYQINASFAGLISEQGEADPIKNGKLTKGYLIFINADDGDSFDEVDATKLELRNYALYYNNKEVNNTYAVFVVSTDEVRGADQTAAWFKMYSNALRNLDKLRQVTSEAERENIHKETVTIWNEANALLYNDVNYIESERGKISLSVFNDIDKKYKDLTQTTLPMNAMLHSNIVTNFTKMVTTGEGDSERDKIITTDVLQRLSLNSDRLSEMLSEQKESYLGELKRSEIKWAL